MTVKKEEEETASKLLNKINDLNTKIQGVHKEIKIMDIERSTKKWKGRKIG